VERHGENELKMRAEQTAEAGEWRKEQTKKLIFTMSI